MVSLSNHAGCEVGRILRQAQNAAFRSKEKVLVTQGLRVKSETRREHTITA
jgi:hypothetical protein